MKLRIVNKFRFIMALTILLLLVGTVLFASFGGARAYSKDPEEFIIHTVDHNETIWSIAEQYHHKDKDIRKLVYEIGEENQIQNQIIFVGQTLKIPKSY